jgi:hypothetical protein
MVEQGPDMNENLFTSEDCVFLKTTAFKKLSIVSRNLFERFDPYSTSLTEADRHFARQKITVA